MTQKDALVFSLPPLSDKREHIIMKRRAFTLIELTIGDDCHYRNPDGNSHACSAVGQRPRT